MLHYRSAVTVASAVTILSLSKECGGQLYLIEKQSNINPETPPCKSPYKAVPLRHENRDKTQHH